MAWAQVFGLDPMVVVGLVAGIALVVPIQAGVDTPSRPSVCRPARVA